MSHPPILEPIVTSTQVLKVPGWDSTFGYMKNAEVKSAFAQRLNELCAESDDIPKKYEGIQVALGKRFGVSQKAARKWLEGEGMPTFAKCIEIAKWGKVHTEWLLTGRGPKYLEPEESTPENGLSELPEHVLAPTLDFIRYQVERNMSGERLGHYLKWLDEMAKRGKSLHCRYPQPPLLLQ